MTAVADSLPLYICHSMAAKSAPRVTAAVNRMTSVVCQMLRTAVYLLYYLFAPFGSLTI